MLPWVCSRRLSPSVTTVRQAIMRMALPIQCMESLFLATYLTAEFKSVRCPHVVASLSVPRLAVAQHVSQMMRLPLSFKSIVAGHTFRHIVLAVEHEVGPRTHLYLPRCLQRGCTRGTGKMGRYWHEPEEDAHAQRLDILGASLQLGGVLVAARGPRSHYECVEQSLSELVREYINRYEEIWHQVVKVYVGFPFAHDTFCQARLRWRVLRLRVDMNDWHDVAGMLDNYAKVANSLFSSYLVRGPWCTGVACGRMLTP